MSRKSSRRGTTRCMWLIWSIRRVKKWFMVVFVKTIGDLDDIIAASRRMRVANKSKGTILMQDETYLQYYLALLFTKEEKKALQELVNRNFQNKE